MLAKELLLLFVLCGVEFTSALSEQREQRSQCRNQTVFCPCTDRRGVSGHVLVVTCSDQNDPKLSVCPGKAFYLEECGKVYFLSKRHRRDTGNCNNGIIPGSPHPSDDADPYIKMSPRSSITRDLDGSYTFECKVYSNFSANVTWLINGKLISLDGKNWKYKLASCNRNLKVNDISKKDEGNYTCVVTNEKGKNYSDTAKLLVRVKGPPVIEYAKLEHGETAYIGTTVNITCSIQGFDHMSGTFLKNNERVSENGEPLKYDYFYLGKKDTPNNFVFYLEIKNVTMEDAGNYTCLALKSEQESRETFLLEVGPCSAGFYCPPGRHGRIPCPQGTYQPNIGETSEQACKPCPFFTNSSKNPSGIRPNVNETDCPGEDPSSTRKVLTSTSQDVTKIAIGVVFGVVFIMAVAFLSFIAKKKRWLWFSSARHSRNSECFICQPMLGENGDIENAECAEVLRQLPEIDYEPRHDVFICYCYKDVGWVKELHAELENRGFKCCIDFKNFAIGAPIMENITEAICYSKKTIAVLSPDFIKSDWCTHELHKALARVRYHQVVPVMYKNCEIPFALQDTTYLEWENCNVKPYFWEQLEKALRKPNGEAYNRRQLQNGSQSSMVSVSL